MLLWMSILTNIRKTMTTNDDIIKKLEAISSPTPSNWREIAEWRVNNRQWLRVSGMIAVQILEQQNGGDNAREYIKNTLGCDDEYASHIVKGDADLHISEALKLIGFDGFLYVLNYITNKNKENDAT